MFKVLCYLFKVKQQIKLAVLTPTDLKEVSPRMIIKQNSIFFILCFPFLWNINYNFSYINYLKILKSTFTEKILEYKAAL